MLNAIQIRKIQVLLTIADRAFQWSSRAEEGRDERNTQTNRESDGVKKILQINFKYNISFDELNKAFKDASPVFVKMKGLEWKIWIHDAEKKMSGGIHLFTDMKSLEAGLSVMDKTLEKMGPAISNRETKVFDVLTELSKQTRAPI